MADCNRRPPSSIPRGERPGPSRRVGDGYPQSPAIRYQGASVGKRQRIFVGDVQGCADELDEILERARGAFGERFELWVVGDLVNRGPDNVRALERVRALVDAGRGRYVLGNHEIALLRVAAGLRRSRRSTASPTSWLGGTPRNGSSGCAGARSSRPGASGASAS